MRLPFTVVHCDSEATEFPASNLHDESPHNPGKKKSRNLSRKHTSCSQNGFVVHSLYKLSLYTFQPCCCTSMPANLGQTQVGNQHHFRSTHRRSTLRYASCHASISDAWMSLLFHGANHDAYPEASTSDASMLAESRISILRRVCFRSLRAQSRFGIWNF